MDWQSNPTDDAIEAVIQQATAAAPYSRPAASLRDTRTQLFVGNLPYRVRWQDLKDLFRKAGTVLRADVSLGPDNRSRGYGTVLLATAEDAGRAVDTFNGYSWQSRILEVRLDRQLQEFDSPSSTSYSLSLFSSPSESSSVTDDLDYPPPTLSDINSRSLFVGNLPFHCQWQDLKDLFRQAGTIVRADVVLGPDGRSRGFGTVVFATEIDAERALKMFNGCEFHGRLLNVHRDKYSFYNQPETTSSSPIPALSSHTPNITLPPGYMIDLLPSSNPASPHEMFKYQHQHHLHDPQHQRQQQLHARLQQYQNRPQHQRHHHQQQRNTPDLENFLDPSSVPKPAASSTTQYHHPSPSSSSRSSSTSIPITTKNTVPTIPIYKPPPLSHATTTSSGSDSSEMFSRLSSTSATSAASSTSKSSLSLSRPHSQGLGYSYEQVLGQGQRRGQPFQTSSPHPVSSSPQSPHPRSKSGSRHCSDSSSSSSSRASQPSSSYHSSYCPPSSSSNHHRPQHPGPISLPPPLLPSQIAFNVPLQQLSPHVRTPHGMSVSVSLSPFFEYPGGFSYSNGMYGQHQHQQQQHQQQPQFGQHMVQVTTPHGLLMTPSMPPFTLLPSAAMNLGSHPTPTGASARVGSGRSSSGHRHARTRSKSLARHLEKEGELERVSDDDENNARNNNANVSVNSRSSSASPPPASSSTRQRQGHHHQQPQQSSQPSRRNLNANAQTITPNASLLNTSTVPQQQPQQSPMQMHINLNSVPGAFSPGVVMTPGTFYGRPGEVPTFKNAAVGAPIGSMRGAGDTSEGGPAGVGGEGQGQQGQVPGQWYQPNQIHGTYFNAMASPRRKTPIEMEPKLEGYFDSLFYTAGMNMGGGGDGGYSSSAGGSGALVHEIMKDGRAQSLGVGVEKEGGEEKGRGREGRGGEEETHISDDGDDEKDSGNDDVDGVDDDDDDDDSDKAEPAGEGQNQNADTCPMTSEDEDGDRRSNQVAGVESLFGSSRESSISRTQSLPMNISHQQQHTSRGLGGVGGVEKNFTDSDVLVIRDARAVPISTKAGLQGTTPIQHQKGGGDDLDGGLERGGGIGLGTIKLPSHVPWKTTTTGRATTDVKEFC